MQTLEALSAKSFANESLRRQRVVDAFTVEQPLDEIDLTQIRGNEDRLDGGSVYAGAAGLTNLLAMTAKRPS
jgi:hypothetical protein